jgi:septal ring factor EnvC (AmiA/AmiB activator)
MPWGKFSGLIGVIAVSAALAAPPAIVASRARLQVARHQLEQHQGEARRLQQAVVAEESRSRQADQALRQRDQAIAKLRDQLRAMRAKPESGRP